MSLYGFCPFCYSDVISRTRGGENAQDTCEKGHKYLSGKTLSAKLARDKLVEEMKELRKELLYLDKKG